MIGSATFNADPTNAVANEVMLVVRRTYPRCGSFISASYHQALSTHIAQRLPGAVAAQVVQEDLERPVIVCGVTPA